MSYWSSVRTLRRCSRGARCCPPLARPLLPCTYGLPPLSLLLAAPRLPLAALPLRQQPGRGGGGGAGANRAVRAAIPKTKTK